MAFILIFGFALLFSPVMVFILTRVNRKMDVLCEKIESQGVDGIPKHFQKKYTKMNKPREEWADLFITTQKNGLQYRRPYAYGIFLNCVGGLAAWMVYNISILM